MLRKPFVLVFIRLRVMARHHEELLRNPSARGAYMLRKPFVLVFIRLRVMARHHEELLRN
jgi:hypothetical protein